MISRYPSMYNLWPPKNYTKHYIMWSNCMAYCYKYSVASTVVVVTAHYEETVQPSASNNMATIMPWWQLWHYDNEHWTMATLRISNKPLQLAMAVWSNIDYELAKSIGNNVHWLRCTCIDYIAAMCVDNMATEALTTLHRVIFRIFQRGFLIETMNLSLS